MIHAGGNLLLNLIMQSILQEKEKPAGRSSSETPLGRRTVRFGSKNQKERDMGLQTAPEAVFH